ncbi:ATP-binding protein [Lentzea cavernae]|uniref:HTH luxR-type domain-containing protein n=1 Tax=Lentzea cavernae TaxID=2020703 RepID=A0ABQ3M696_9PSEU|nr:LuxR family transcriptional regulator [Lentzea cavernae]GHH34773.1 hypothetical protein GCM10017774_19280 [Lentzea cavernae]
MTALDVVATALRLARSGTGSLVVLRGPLGCGRSTTMKDARRVAKSLGFRVLRATGALQEQDFPFAVERQLTGEELSGMARTGGLHEVLAGPALVAVDDLQWADEESLRVLARLAGRLDRIPVVMVVCVRDGDVGSGTPLVEQVVRQAAHVVALQRPQLAEGSRRKLVSCLRAQPPWVRAVLNAMAVLGDSDAGVIAQLAEVDEVGCATALRAADGLGLVDRSPPRFVHRVVREAVEETMSPAERVRLQGKAVRLLHDAGRPAEVVARLLLAITVAQGLWAVEVLRTAAVSAIERGAPLVAVEYLRRALFDHPEAGPRRAALLVELAAAQRGVDRAAAAAHLSDAARMVTSTGERAAIAARIVPGGLAEARELLRSVEDELRGARPHDEVLGDLALRVEARAHHAECRTPVRCADRVGARPDETFPATSAGRELLAVRLHCATTASAWRAEEVAAVAQRLLAHAPPRPDHVHTPIATLVSTLCAADSVDAVSSWLHNAMERALAANATAEQVFIEAEQALVLLHRGRTTAARDIAVNVLATRGLASEVLVVLASIAVQTRDDHLVGRLVPLVKEQAHDPALSVAHAMLCGVAAVDLQAGLAHLRDAGAQLEELGWRNPVLHPWRAEAARTLWRLGDVAAAQELAVHQHALAVEWGSAAGIGTALCHLGSMTEGNAGVRTLREAVGVLEGSANRFALARALWQVGVRTADRHHVARSSVVAVECGERPLVARAEPVAGHGSGLTGAQQRVVELALAGRSNQEIADFMRVGVRVVEKHLTNAYRRLGVRGRSGLPGALSATGRCPWA